MCYLIGKLEILKIREKYRGGGAPFNFREFHDKLLRCGSIPLHFVAKTLKL
jgi:uncharacterized protein (DUF885 family)